MPHGRAGEYTPVMSRRSVLVVDGWRLELERRRERAGCGVSRGVCGLVCVRDTNSSRTPHPRGRRDAVVRATARDSADAGGAGAGPARKERFDKTHTAWRGVWLGGLRTFFWSTLHISAQAPAQRQL
jgi:hypothetical protein